MRNTKPRADDDIAIGFFSFPVYLTEIYYKNKNSDLIFDDREDQEKDFFKKYIGQIRINDFEGKCPFCGHLEVNIEAANSLRYKLFYCDICNRKFVVILRP